MGTVQKLPDCIREIQTGLTTDTPEDIFFAEDRTERMLLDVFRELAGRTVP